MSDHIFVLAVQRPGDDKTTNWYFDDPVAFVEVKRMLTTLGVRFATREDYITDADEFRRWFKRED